MGTPFEVTRLIVGRLVGRVWPERPAPRPLAVDGRTVALRTLGRYLGGLTFWRAGDVGGPPIPFRIPSGSFFVEEPDDKQSMPFPCIVVLPGEVQYRPIGFVPYVEEGTLDQYGKGTVVRWQDEAVETIQLEVWANMKAERRAILGGIETAMSPIDGVAGVRFRMPEYWGQVCSFLLDRRRNVDDANSARKRRSALVSITMRHTVAHLVDAATMRPVVRVSAGVGLAPEGPGARRAGP